MQNPAPTGRRRADRLLVERGLFESRAKAQAAIAAGLVVADGAVVRKASDEIAVDAQIEATPAHPYVSRGGLKLAAALDEFGISAAGQVCLDIGASTGGFTQVLLERGARLVYAVDVGRDQLHASLRGRADVVSLEATDIRNFDAAHMIEPASLVTIDVSFISLALVVPAAIALAAPRAAIVALIKPQFEAGRDHVRKGIVRDAEVHRSVCARTTAMFSDAGWNVMGVIPSPIDGGDGNREYLIGAARGG